MACPTGTALNARAQTVAITVKVFFMTLPFLLLPATSLPADLTKGVACDSRQTIDHPVVNALTAGAEDQSEQAPRRKADGSIGSPIALRRPTRSKTRRRNEATPKSSYGQVEKYRLEVQQDSRLDLRHLA